MVFICESSQHSIPLGVLYMLLELDNNPNLPLMLCGVTVCDELLNLAWQPLPPMYEHDGWVKVACVVKKCLKLCCRLEKHNMITCAFSITLSALTWHLL